MLMAISSSDNEEFGRSDSAENEQARSGLSEVDSFSDDPAAEVLRLRAMLRKREEQLQQRTKLLSQREELLRESKEIIDRLIAENNSLKTVAHGSAGHKEDMHMQHQSAANASSQPAKLPTNTIQAMITQQEAALTHVVERVGLFRKAERELLAENEQLRGQLAEAEARSVENAEAIRALQRDLADKTSSMESAQADWENTLQTMTAKHSAVLEKYAQKKAGNGSLQAEVRRLTDAVAASEGRASSLQEQLTDLQGKQEKDRQKYVQIVRQLEQKQATHDIYAERAAVLERENGAHQEREASLRAQLDQAAKELASVRDDCAAQLAVAAQRADDLVDRRYWQRERDGRKAVIAKTMATLSHIIDDAESGASTSRGHLPPPFEYFNEDLQGNDYARVDEMSTRDGKLHRAEHRGRVPGPPSRLLGARDTVHWQHEVNALRLSHTDILRRVCATLDLSEPKELIPFSIRISKLLACGHKLQAFVNEVRNLAGGPSDDAALRKLRELPALRHDLKQLRDFKERVHEIIVQRPTFSAVNGSKPNAESGQNSLPHM